MSPGGSGLAWQATQQKTLKIPLYGGLTLLLWFKWSLLEDHLFHNRDNVELLIDIFRGPFQNHNLNYMV